MKARCNACLIALGLALLLAETASASAPSKI